MNYDGARFAVSPAPEDQARVSLAATFDRGESKAGVITVALRGG